jgi:TATA-box binding protein (TBP) (component of TFIID and TFIIIB)
LIFNSAKIVITGSNSFEHTKLCYDFVNKLIFKHYKDFVQIRF